MNIKSERKDARRAAARHTRMLCLAALLAALSFLLGWLAKSIQGEAPVRITLEGLPIVFAALSLGPFYGAGAAVVADLLSCLLAGMAPLPLITAGAGCIGLIPGVLSLLLRRRVSEPPRFFSLLAFDGVAHLVGSVLLKSYALSHYYGLDFLLTLLARLPVYCGVILVESYLLYILLRSSAVRRELERQVLK